LLPATLSARTVTVRWDASEYDWTGGIITANTVNLEPKSMMVDRNPFRFTGLTDDRARVDLTMQKDNRTYPMVLYPAEGDKEFTVTSRPPTGRLERRLVIEYDAEVWQGAAVLVDGRGYPRLDVSGRLEVSSLTHAEHDVEVRTAARTWRKHMLAGSENLTWYLPSTTVPKWLGYALGAALGLLAVLAVVLLGLWLKNRRYEVAASTATTGGTGPTTATLPYWPDEYPRQFPFLQPVRELGKGGIARCFWCYDWEQQAYVAVKVLHDSFITDSSGTLRNRFLDEYFVLNRLRHTGIAPQPFKVSHPSTHHPWFSMEALQMESMRRLQMPLEWEQAKGFMYLLCQAVRTIHQEGIIHRDLSPENVMYGSDPNGNLSLRLIDFGGAKVLRKRNDFSRQDFFVEGTMDNEMMGKVRYTAPEQWESGIKTANELTDAYCVAIVCWELVMGAPPFRGRSAAETRQSHKNATRDPRPLIYRGIPQPVAEALCWMMMADRDLRYSLPQFVQVLESYL
jgi:serine/threonine-protein kinase